MIIHRANNTRRVHLWRQIFNLCLFTFVRIKRIIMLWKNTLTILTSSSSTCFCPSQSDWLENIVKSLVLSISATAAWVLDLICNFFSSLIFHIFLRVLTTTLCFVIWIFVNKSSMQRSINTLVYIRFLLRASHHTLLSSFSFIFLQLS